MVFTRKDGIFMGYVSFREGMDNKNRPAMENATGFHKLRHIASLPLEAVLLPEATGVII